MRTLCQIPGTPESARQEILWLWWDKWFRYTTKGSEEYVGIRLTDGTELSCPRDVWPTEELFARIALYKETHAPISENVSLFR